ncbi:MAG: phosphoenolpyruvate synthase, partial [Deltaproteobacteria bacterium]|nr:phosphoenolpyruvate synthase [Deltaproteobacteria bacterium]
MIDGSACKRFIFFGLAVSFAVVLWFPQLAAASSSASTVDTGEIEEMRGWIEEFKLAPRGPFENIRWFCEDGTVLPPKAYACVDHGGGIQHGALNEKANTLRERGYFVANVLTGLTPEQFVGQEADLASFKSLLIERFLMGWDDGWIFHKARSYRGAFQSEDEEAGAQKLMLVLWSDPAWRDPERFLLPLGADESSATIVRQQALEVANKDAGFAELRGKIHGLPDAGDAESVRRYAREKGKKELQPDYEKLATSIDELYAQAAAADLCLQVANTLDDGFGLKTSLLNLGPKLDTDVSLPSMRISVAARLMGLIRKYLPQVTDAETALALFHLSLALEAETYTAGNAIIADLDTMNRAERIDMLDRAAEALYGSGFLSVRQLIAVKESRGRIEAGTEPTLTTYREELGYLGRVAQWSGQSLEFQFSLVVAKLSPIEPLVHMYTQDRLRGSPLLFYSRIIDTMSLDANRLAGIEHQLFDQRIGAGLRALNPGLARGVLYTTNPTNEADYDSKGIYILPETIADLPPVAGILTRGEGSSLSHVQLLARNLGIPNVVIREDLIRVLEGRNETRVVMAVSPSGLVQLVADGPSWDSVFGREKEEQTELVIRPNLEKLDLAGVDLLPLSNLRATDSGRTSGPKGANLGELKHFFGELVPDGFVVPFGTFRRLLDSPLEIGESETGESEPGGSSVWDWMKLEFDAIAEIEDPAAKQERASAFLKRLRTWMISADAGDEFHNALRTALDQQFGQDGSYGVFLRSDTNVEDLAGFTGAGLNLTVPNVVGYDNILTAIHDVWASPFTDRSYSWRQSHMTDPEYVFPAVVVQVGFNSEKSGVMVTTDLETGSDQWLSVAVNEGVGGAVEGQAAESLRVHRDTGEVRLLAQATTPNRVQLNPQGGIDHFPASGADTLLVKGEIAQLVGLAKDVRERFTSLRDEEGNILPADIEFAFKNGKLALLQIRPFVESKQAQTSSYLAEMDSALGATGSVV